MRRPAVLAFGLFALAACLPAEVRECLPMSAACEHRARLAGASCARVAAATPACARGRQTASSCPKTRRPPEPESCQLHPTPEATPTRELLQLAAPAVAEPPVPAVEPVAADTTRDGWLEAPEPRPRASPLGVPLSPRPPPLAV